MNSSQVTHQRTDEELRDDRNTSNTDWLNLARTFDTLRETDICTTDEQENIDNDLNANPFRNENEETDGDVTGLLDARRENPTSMSFPETWKFPVPLADSHKSGNTTGFHSHSDSHSGRESPYDNVECSSISSHNYEKSADCSEVIEQMLGASREESLDKLSTSLYDDDSSDLLFEELTNEVVSALTEGLDYNRWSKENLLGAQCKPKTESISSLDDLSNSNSKTFPVENDKSLYERNLRRVERLKTNTDREKALQWAQRLDSLISESSCRSKHPIWGSSVDGDEFVNNETKPEEVRDQGSREERKKRRHKCVSAWYGAGDVASVEDVTKRQDRLSHASLDLLMSLSSDFLTESERDINNKEAQREYPSVAYRTGMVCDTIEEAQDVLATRYLLPEIAVKKAIITWSRWNIQDLIRSPSSQSDVWNPDIEPRLQLAQILLEMRDISEQIEQREEVISRLLKAKTESKIHPEDSLDTEEDFEEERKAVEVLECEPINDKAKTKRHKRKQYSSVEDRSEADPRNKSLIPPTTIVNSSVQFVHRWIRFIIRSLSRNRRNGSRR